MFLAFPSGRLEHRADRILIGVGYFTSFGLHAVNMMLGGFGPDNLLEVVDVPSASATLLDVELVILSGVTLTGVGVLAARRRARHDPCGGPQRSWSTRSTSRSWESPRCS